MEFVQQRIDSASLRMHLAFNVYSRALVFPILTSVIDFTGVVSDFFDFIQLRQNEADARFWILTFSLKSQFYGSPFLPRKEKNRSKVRFDKNKTTHSKSEL